MEKYRKSEQNSEKFQIIEVTIRKVILWVLIKITWFPLKKEFCHSKPRRFNCLTSSVRQEGVFTHRKVAGWKTKTFLRVQTPSCLTEEVRQLNLLGFEWQNSFIIGNQVILIKTHRRTFVMVTSMNWNFLCFAPIFYIFPIILVVFGV